MNVLLIVGSIVFVLLVYFHWIRPVAVKEKTTITQDQAQGQTLEKR